MRRIIEIVVDILVNNCDIRQMRALECEKPHCQLMAQFKRRVASEIREALALFLAYMVAVGDVAVCDCGKPLLRTHLVLLHRLARVADFVVIHYRVLGLLAYTVCVGRPCPELQQFPIEITLLRLRVGVEKGLQAPPDNLRRIGIAGVSAV